MTNKKNNKLMLYRIKGKYIDFLASHDSKVMEKNKRLYIGIVLKINTHTYFAPLTSFKPKKHKKIKDNSFTAYKIKNGEYGVVSLINMIPVLESEIININIDDLKYKEYLTNQIRYINKNRKTIKSRATSLYEARTNGNSEKLLAICYDFKLLEKKSIEYQKEANLCLF